MSEGHNHSAENHVHSSHTCSVKRVSLRDRLIMLFLVVVISAVLLRPFVALQSFSRANSFIDAGFYKEAINHYKRGILLNPGFWEAYSWLGFAYQKDKQTRKAIGAYTRAVALNPKDKQAYLELGLIYFKKKDFDKAAYYFGKVSKIDANDLNAKNLEALSYEKMGKIEKAILTWKEILESNPNFAPARKNLERLESKTQ